MPSLPRLECDIENRAGVRQGEGPLTNVPWLRYAHRLGMAGDFDTVLPLRDERTSLVAEKTSVLRFFWNGVQVFVGVVEATGRQVLHDGTLHLPVSGRCLGGAELSEASIGFLELTSGTSGVTNGPAQILTAADTFTPGTWSLDTTLGYSTTSTAVYAKFAGESALSALVKVAEKIGERWRFSTTDDRKMIWLRATTPSSGIRALAGAPDMVRAEGNPEICFFDSFEEERDVYGLFTRIYPYGGGNVEIATKLLATSRTAGTGFTLDAANNYIESDDATTAIGHVIPKHVQFTDVRPISNTDADIVSAANMLYDSALSMLQRHDTVEDFRVFRLGGIVQLPSAVLPGTTLRVLYEDERYSVDEELFVLEIDSTIDQAGRHVHSLAVGAVDRLPAGEGGSTSNQMEDGRLWQTHPIRNVNSYEIGVYRPIYHDGGSINEAAYIYFDFDAEVTEVQQVLLKFQTDGGTPPVMRPLESTVLSVGGESTTTDSGGSSSPSSEGGGSSSPSSESGGSSSPTSEASSASSSGSSSEPGTTGAQTANHTHTETGTTTSIQSADHAHNFTTPAHSHTIAHTHTVNIGGHTHTVNISSHTHTVNISSHTHDLTPNITAVYGIFREDTANTFRMEDLRYRINGGSWTALDAGAVSIEGSDRYKVDLTSQLHDAYMRPNQASNVIEIRRIIAGTGGRVSCMVDGTLKIRTIVQSTAAS